MKKGNFIVFEGGEGSGKDTNIDQLKSDYSDRTDIVFTREPGGTFIGERIRELLFLETPVPMSIKTELLLFLSTRAQLLSEVIIPALKDGKTVVSNRFVLSTIAYQIYGREHKEFLDFLVSVNEFIVGEWKPDTYILLDVSPKVGLARVVSRKGEINRFDTEKIAFHERVREGYLKHVGDTGTPHTINAERPFKDVYKDVSSVFSKYYN